jgi:hypothetical protein
MSTADPAVSITITQLPTPTPSTANCVDTTGSPWGRASIEIVDGDTIVGRIDERYSQDCNTWWARAFAYPNPNGSSILSLQIQRKSDSTYVDDASGGPAQELVTSQSKLTLSANSPDQYLIVVVEQVGSRPLPPQTL